MTEEYKETETTEEERETFTRLVEYIEVSPEEAERMMRDDDLWVIPPEMRLEVSDEEAVEEWREAYCALEDLVHVANRLGAATMVAIMDAHRRAGVALERAKERVRRGEG